MADSKPPAYAPEPAVQQPGPGQVNPPYAQPGAPVVYLQVYSWRRRFLY